MKETCYLIEWKKQLAIPNQKRWSHMIPYLEEYLNVKDLRFQSIPSRGIVNQTSLESDWTRDTWDWTIIFVHKI